MINCHQQLRQAENLGQANQVTLQSQKLSKEWVTKKDPNKRPMGISTGYKYEELSPTSSKCDNSGQAHQLTLSWRKESQGNFLRFAKLYCFTTTLRLLANVTTNKYFSCASQKIRLTLKYLRLMKLLKRSYDFSGLKVVRI